MISGKLRRIVSRSALTLAFAIGMGAAATLSPARADEHHGEWHDGDGHHGEWHGGDGHHGEWHDGHWGYWGWQGGVHVFIAEPYPYPYASYPPPPPAYYAPPPPVVYVAPPVVAPSFGVFIGVGHH